MTKKKLLIGSALVILLIGIISCILFFSYNRPISKKEQKEIIQTLNKPFSAKANIRLDGTTLVADINKTSPNALTLQVTEPAALKDLIYTYDGKDITVSYKSMHVSINDESVLSKVASGIIMKAVNSSTSDTGVSMSSKDGALIVRGESEEGKFTMQVDKKSGSILNLHVPSLDLECEFSNFMFLNENS